MAAAEIPADVDFLDFALENPPLVPLMEIPLDPEDHPRLISGHKQARLFAQRKGSGHYEALMDIARQFWIAGRMDERPSNPASPGFLSVAAYAAANQEYLKLAIDEIDKTLAAVSGGSSERSLDALTWAALGWDTIGLMISGIDSEVGVNSARDALDKDLLPMMRDRFLAGKLTVSRESLSAENWMPLRAYCAAFLWEMAITESHERIRELLMGAYPVLSLMQSAVKEHMDEFDYAAVNELLDDSLLLAILAWERASGNELLDIGMLNGTLDRAYDFSRAGFRSDGAAHFATDEGFAALMHLVKWRNLLDEDRREAVESWMEPGGYSAEALMHIFYKPLDD